MITVDMEVDISDVVLALRAVIEERYPHLDVRNITVKTWNHVVFKTERDDHGDKLPAWNHRVDITRKQL